ncbi:MAG: NAD(P)/FAD-dependent oxidoreductase [Rhizobiales bacterium]|nr:NAD(P)/FAD-dependent oxidoreductase [Hyphomicrobiales bacterium]
MRHAETIIIGGGPAGSSCAWKLRQRGHDVLILDKAEFPRLKLCAGWITTKVMQDLQFSQDDYPHPILKLQIHSHIKGLPFSLRGLPTPGDNYSIRRVEFDHWLLHRSDAETIQHTVKTIRRDGDLYIVDDQFSCRNLVGAGGTSCPIRRNFFPDNRRKFRQVVTLEHEFEYPDRADICHLYFRHYGAKAYAWYFPKADGFVNIGLGGKANAYKMSEKNIHQHFKSFLFDLVEQGLLDRQTAENFHSTGHPYYLYSDHGEVKKDRIYLIGDAAGLATVDLGEGIGPAIESALMAADEILGSPGYMKNAVTQFSTAGLAQRLARRFIAPKAVQ